MDREIKDLLSCDQVVCSIQVVIGNGKCGNITLFFPEDATDLFIIACRTCSTIIFPHSINQIVNL